MAYFAAPALNISFIGFSFTISFANKCHESPGAARNLVEILGIFKLLSINANQERGMDESYTLVSFYSDDFWVIDK
ncbi:MAG: hypothetical protein RI932_1885 [Pseudomonadota bacterium]